MAIANPQGYTGGDSTHGQIYLSALGYLVTQQTFFAQSYPFPASITLFDPVVASALGVGHAVWSFSPTLLDAPHPAGIRPRAVPRPR